MLDVDAPDGDVTVGIRPEGFLPDENGALVCDLEAVEVMGRDVTVVCRHLCCGAAIRAIVDADTAITGKTVRFRLKENKVFLFHKETGERL